MSLRLDCIKLQKTPRLNCRFLYGLILLGCILITFSEACAPYETNNNNGSLNHKNPDVNDHIDKEINLVPITIAVNLSGAIDATDIMNEALALAVVQSSHKLKLLGVETVRIC